ncbi:MAG: hypothetical protein RIF32_13015, partial [Leptospirales bacterium]
MTDSTNTQPGGGQVLGRLVEGLRGMAARIRPACLSFGSWFRTYLSDLSERPEVRFRTVLWAICIMFVGFFTLVGTNPFRLLFPDSFFHPPATDRRSAVTLYGISVENQRPVKIQRRVSLEGEPDQLVTRIAFAVSR